MTQGRTELNNPVLSAWCQTSHLVGFFLELSHRIQNTGIETILMIHITLFIAIPNAWSLQTDQSQKARFPSEGFETQIESGCYM